MIHITKKVFKEHSSVHTYGRSSTAMRVLYFDWQAGYSKESGSFAGFKYAIAAQFTTKAELINLAYDRIVRNEFVNHTAWHGHRVAITDKQRFKVQIVFNEKPFTFSQEAYEKTSYYEMTEKRKQRESEPATSDKDDLPF